MNNKRFRKILIAIAVIGVLLTCAHVGYIIYAYENSSIIYFVSQEFWP